QEHVRLLEREHRLVTRQRDVDRIDAALVEHRRDLVGATDPASGTLAELGALLGGNLDLGHGDSLLGGGSSIRSGGLGSALDTALLWSALSITVGDDPRRGNLSILTHGPRRAEIE